MQNYVYPASSQVTVSGIGTPNNAAIPNSSVLIAGESPAGNQTVVQTDSAGNLIVSPLASSSTVTVVQPTGTNLHAVIDSSALPTGASTSALQTSGNASLSTIATNTTGVSTAALQTSGNSSLTSIATSTGTLATNSATLGQKASAGSAPVVIASDQSAIPVTGAFFQATQPVSGTVTVTQATAANLNATVTGTVTVANNTYAQASTTSGQLGQLIQGAVTTVAPTYTTATTNPLSLTTAGAIRIDGSGAVSPLPTGGSTSALQTTGNTSLATIATNTAIKTNNGTLTNSSATTSATPSTSTTLVAVNAARRYLLIQNVSTTATVWINFTSAATAGLGSFMLLPGGVLAQETGFVSTEAVTGLSTTASVPVTIKQA